jgi:hypothetical protein
MARSTDSQPLNLSFTLPEVVVVAVRNPSAHLGKLPYRGKRLPIPFQFHWHEAYVSTSLRPDVYRKTDMVFTALMKGIPVLGAVLDAMGVDDLGAPPPKAIDILRNLLKSSPGLVMGLDNLEILEAVNDYVKEPSSSNGMKLAQTTASRINDLARDVSTKECERLTSGLGRLSRSERRALEEVQAVSRAAKGAGVLLAVVGVILDIASIPDAGAEAILREIAFRTLMSSTALDGRKADYHFHQDRICVNLFGFHMAAEAEARAALLYEFLSLRLLTNGALHEALRFTPWGAHLDLWGEAMAVDLFGNGPGCGRLVWR